MTRKDYELIASALRASRIQTNKDEWNDRYMTQHRVMVYSLADALQSENSRFDREKFRLACGVSSDTVEL